MKHLFVTITFLAIVATGFAQQPEKVLPVKTTNLFTTGNAKNELGIDITWFIKNLVNFGNSTTYSNNYLLSYKRLLKKNHALRFGIGGTVHNGEETINLTSMQDQNKSTSYHLNARMGYEFRNPFGKRWLFYYGGDFLTGYYHFKQSTTHTSTSVYTSEVKSKTFTWGIGPVIGFEFALNSRLSLSTEGSFYFTHSYSKENYTNSTSPASSKETTRKTSFANIQVPVSLYVNYRF